MHLAVEGPLHILEFLLQNSSDCPDGVGPLDNEDSSLLHHALSRTPQSPDICRLIARKYPTSVSHRNTKGQLPSLLVK